MKQYHCDTACITNICYLLNFHWCIYKRRLNSIDMSMSPRHTHISALGRDRMSWDKDLFSIRLWRLMQSQDFAIQRSIQDKILHCLWSKPPVQCYLTNFTTAVSGWSWGKAVNCGNGTTLRFTHPKLKLQGCLHVASGFKAETLTAANLGAWS